MLDTTTIRIAKNTKERLHGIMRYGDTLDSKINDLLDMYHIMTRPKIQSEPKKGLGVSSGLDSLLG